MHATISYSGESISLVDLEYLKIRVTDRAEKVACCTLTHLAVDIKIGGYQHPHTILGYVVHPQFITEKHVLSPSWLGLLQISPVAVPPPATFFSWFTSSRSRIVILFNVSFFFIIISLSGVREGLKPKERLRLIHN
jgi:hypothetical protein